jgi:hypothetical protein
MTHAPDAGSRAAGAPMVSRRGPAIVRIRLEDGSDA